MGSGVIDLSQLLGSPSFSPSKFWEYRAATKAFPSQLVKPLCLSEMVTEAPFPSSLKDSPPPVLFSLVMFGNPVELTGPGSGLLS